MKALITHHIIYNIPDDPAERAKRYGGVTDPRACADIDEQALRDGDFSPDELGEAASIQIILIPDAPSY